MWADLALGGGLSLLRQGMGFRDAKQRAEEKKAWQAYRNTMVNLSNAQNLNAITTNESLLRRDSVLDQFAIERSEYLTSAQAEVAAAAAGTGGRSVNSVMFDIEHNAAVAQSRRKRELEDKYRQLDHQRVQSEFQTAMSMDFSPIPKPNPATYLLNFGTEAARLYSRSTPK